MYCFVTQTNWLPEKEWPGLGRGLKLQDLDMGELLGKGAYAKVVKAVFKSTGESYALKVLEKQAIEKYNLQDQLLAEIHILLSLDHPNIMKLHTHFEDARYIYLLMELSTDGTLFNKLSPSGCQDESLIAHQLLDLFRAVAYLHSREPPIIHRDIKPENILCFGDTLKLADFGSSNLKDKVLRQTMCGTPEYLAPEMILKQGHNEKVDVWCLGILAYELFCGHTPFCDVLYFSPVDTSRNELFSMLTTSIVVVSAL